MQVGVLFYEYLAAIDTKTKGREGGALYISQLACVTAQESVILVGSSIERESDREVNLFDIANCREILIKYHDSDRNVDGCLVSAR